MEENFRGSSRAAEPRQGVPRAGWARATWAPGGSWRKISGGHPGLRSPGRGCLGRVGRGPRGPLEGHGGRFQGVIPGCGAQAGGASGGSGEGPGGPWRVMEDDFRGSSRAAEPRQGVPRAGRAGAPGAPGGSWRTISGGHAGTPRPARGCLGRVGRGPRGPLEGHGGRFQGVMRGRPGPPGGASGGSGEGHGGVLEVSVSARVPGARACLGWSTRGTSLPLPEYQDHESAFAGVPGPRDKPSFRKQRPPERRSGRTPDALPGSRGAPNGPFHRCQLALFLRFSRLLSFMRRRVKHHLTDRLAHQTRHRRAPAGRPAKRRCSGGRFLRPAGRPLRPGGPCAGGSETETPRLPQPSSHGARGVVEAPPPPGARDARPQPAAVPPANTAFLEPSAQWLRRRKRASGAGAPCPAGSGPPPHSPKRGESVRDRRRSPGGYLVDPANNLEPIAGPRGGDVSFECLPYQLSMVLSVPTMVTTGNGESGIHWRASLVPAAAVIPAPIAYLKVAAVKKLVVGSRDRADGPPRGELPSVPAPASRRPLDALS
ncbi:hypothetical protein Q8A73_023850 [Channa argus]|nr:hypothetical protein Q8A73_023836 [Channa argus]KAK2875766.1 hypothetical protein Q8A73_023843 [Channa argus]KAK2875773.1 hypothetical protein Q8A73_023850 [Channa argus]